MIRLWSAPAPAVFPLPSRPPSAGSTSSCLTRTLVLAVSCSKQIHKFFGSKEHRAKVRGFRIGDELLAEADTAGVTVVLDATVIGLYEGREVVVRVGMSCAM